MKKDKENKIRHYLTLCSFNKKQIEFILEQIHYYNNLKENEEFFDYDCYERDMWYTMNRSGLFEKDNEENETEIDDWSPNETRDFITEIDYYL